MKKLCGNRRSGWEKTIYGTTNTSRRDPAFFAQNQGGEAFVCVLMLAYEALGYSQYDRIKKTDSNKIAEIMHGMKDWETAGIRRFKKYSRQRAWKRKNAPRLRSMVLWMFRSRWSCRLINKKERTSILTLMSTLFSVTVSDSFS